MLVPFQLDFFKNGFTSILLCLAMLVIAITLIIYMTSLQNYIKNHQLTPDQERTWKPSRVLRKVLTAGLICAIVIFAAAAFVQTLSSLQETTVEAQNNLTNILSGEENSEASEDTTKTAEAVDNTGQKADEKDAAAESPKEGDAAEHKTDTEETVQSPNYVGAAEVHGTVVTLRFSAECEGRFIPAVTVFLNEEIIEMMKREGIEMLRPLNRDQGEK